MSIVHWHFLKILCYHWFT